LTDLLSLLGVLLLLLLVLAGCYLVTRMLGTGLGGRFGMPAGSRRLQVLDRVLVGRDQAILVVQAAGRYFLLGSSPSGFSLLAELTGEEGEAWRAQTSLDDPPRSAGPDFRAALRRFREKK